MATTKSGNSRALAATAITQVIKDHRSLREVLPQVLAQADSSQAGLIHELTAGGLRWWWKLSAIYTPLLQKPLRNKDFDIEVLIALGVYQLEFTRIPPHAAVSESVNAASLLGKPWARKLINAVLRRYLREKPELTGTIGEREDYIYAHPPWMIAQIKQDWPDHWQQILHANNQQAPLTLRVNRLVSTTEQAIDRLAEQNISARATRYSTVGINLDAGVKIWQTPLWSQALFSVQDESAQLAGQSVQLKSGMKVLDACAAPGGKTAHLLESQPDIDLTALELEAGRAEQIKENLHRLNLSCTIKTTDAGDVGNWWRGHEFDLIIIDAPCSGTGVIRRHPDIKHLRRPGDIAENVETQRRLLVKLWPLLKPGGKLLYCTCSIFRQENDLQARWLLENRSDAALIALPDYYGLDVRFGRQRLPGVDEADGFYYAYFEKRPS